MAVTLVSMIPDGEAKLRTRTEIRQQRLGMAELLLASRLSTQTHVAASRALVYETRRILAETAETPPQEPGG